MWTRQASPLPPVAPNSVIVGFEVSSFKDMSNGKMNFFDGQRLDDYYENNQKNKINCSIQGENFGSRLGPTCIYDRNSKIVNKYPASNV